MEEKKFNNAIEKAENLSEDTQKAKHPQEPLSKEERLSLERQKEAQRAAQRVEWAENKKRQKEEKYDYYCGNRMRKNSEKRSFSGARRA
jgi:hypothetical protein